MQMSSIDTQSKNTANLVLIVVVLLAVSLLVFLWHSSNDLADDYRAVNHLDEPRDRRRDR